MLQDHIKICYNIDSSNQTTFLTRDVPPKQLRQYNSLVQFENATSQGNHFESTNQPINHLDNCFLNHPGHIDPSMNQLRERLASSKPNLSLNRSYLFREILQWIHSGRSTDDGFRNSKFGSRPSTGASALVSPRNWENPVLGLQAEQKTKNSQREELRRCCSRCGFQSDASAGWHPPPSFRLSQHVA